MSHAVVRGEPNAAQLYLDTLLNEVLLEQGIKPDAQKRDMVTLSQIMYHTLKQQPDAEFMINGATGEIITNAQLLKYAVSLARALTARNAKGKTAMCLMRNHQFGVGIYFAVMFSGVVPFMMDPNTTVYELTHFLKLIEPSFIFYDKEHHEFLIKALQSSDLTPVLLMADVPGPLEQFVGGHSGDLAGFEVAPASMEDAVMFLPTSGSTGVPKAAIITHRGLVIQLPSIWSYHTQFPTPTSRVMILTTMQWMTFTLTITACVAYRVPILISPRLNTVESVTEMLEKFKPTWTFTSPAFATGLVASIRADQWSSLETLILLGAAPANDLMAALKEKLPQSCHLCDGYGATEAQGFISIPDKQAPTKCNGWAFNIFHYKIVDDNGEKLGLNEKGELYLKGESIIKGYYRNDISYDEIMTPDGWYKTGDEFYVDENERLAFVVRKKFCFKYMGCQVAPEEVERVIGSVPGVHENVVCATDNGPAAAVVLHPGAKVSREQIRQAVDACLSDHKRLHGGIVFVPSLHHTHTGKLQRRECGKLIAEMIENGQCF